MDYSDIWGYSPERRKQGAQDIPLISGPTHSLTLKFGSKDSSSNDLISLHRSGGNSRVVGAKNKLESQQPQASDGELWFLFQPVDKIMDLIEDVFKERFGAIKGHKVAYKSINV